MVLFPWLTLPPVRALGWGLVAGSSLFLGALVGYQAPLSRHALGSIMAFGAGVLMSALSFELIGESFRTGGLWWMIAGTLLGTATFTSANWLLVQKGAHDRKRSGSHQAKEDNASGSGKALALGALLDGIPESVAIGLSLAQGGRVSIVTVVAIFLSNLPEALSSAAGMRRAGRGRRYVLCLWGGIALMTGLAALAGCVLLAHASQATGAFVLAIAAGAILTMIADTMIPEAFENAHALTGLLLVSGFLVSFSLGHVWEE
jgi:zinc transporter, ZIP family